MPNVSEGVPPLGKKQANLLTAVLRGVPVLGPGKEPRPLTDTDVRALLDTLPPCADAQETGEVNRLRPRLLNALVGPEARRSGYIQGLPRHGAAPLLRSASEAVRAPLVLRVVYGASTTIPLRALSYVLPAVRMAGRLTEAGHRAPHLQIVLAGSLGCWVNGLSRPAVAEETTLLTRCLGLLLSSLVPGRFGIYGTLPSRDVVTALDDLVRTLTPARRARVLERLGGKGGATADEQTLRYAAAHVLVHDRAAIPLTLCLGSPVPENAVVIDVGGLQERHFHDVRRLFASGPAGGTGPGALVLSRHSVPPYTMARGGDVGLREYLADGSPQSRTLASAVRHDLRLLWSAPLPELLRPVVEGPRERRGPADEVLPDVPHRTADAPFGRGDTASHQAAEVLQGATI
ncbi:hypothetical protein ACH3Y9_23735 [Streptomyces sp. WSLK1-5]|uniref:hypothetical protein n=1 Tax=unclassified Streptomyces TaxID=2593676 RepID=UPI0021ADBBF4|nr:hypothetical protein [Streptomyces sp. RP5T]